ncbi:phage holin family protein [Flavobacterium caseinilyticum]|uniref:Competence protein n=1 Tax=Flavobacterium caseinilyticum TaxID=2541732 RepID=A0A4R5B0S9_9FLAO|nr:phage holin family protein [Flavobacterium caseinilyticum]TDD78189.1 competence protein [Flavobacterium caseinilyticum]
MAFDELKENKEEIQDQIHAYIKSNVAYYKLLGFKVAMKSTTMIFKFTLIFMCFSMVLLFCSIAGALAIGNYLNNYPLGFLIIGGIYLVVTGLLFLIKERIFEGSIMEKFSEKFFKD